ncbi:MAG: sugar ABC transporter ATP-binding protein [Synergistaceae bacterium]|jgi:simple sugar transport system ATP-binding protein|nr:sugar ABC transporter ATP-binding protein [Synergistaceae bacterium]
MAGKTVLEMRGVTKNYADNRVLKNVTFDVKAGEIHSLIGENGAGKSTLMNILFGMPVIHESGGFSGEIVFEGKTVNIMSPQDAMKLGIGMVHQEFVLLPGFSVLENVKLNREATKPNFLSRISGRAVGKKLETLDYAAMRRDVRAALESLAVSIDEMTPVRGLPVGYMQFVEIARELDKSKIRLLVLDEPTAVLTESEAETLLAAMRRLEERGIAILFISHRLGEVASISERVTVMRDGEIAARLTKDELSVPLMAELMVGRKLAGVERRDAGTTGVPGPEETILKVEGLRVHMPGENIAGVDLEVRRGEILGIAGLAGQGKVGIANGIMGIYPSEGSVRKDGRVVPLNDAAAAAAARMALVSEDRRGVGLLLEQSIEENIALRALQAQGRFLRRVAGFSFADSSAIRSHAKKMIEELDIRCTGPEQKVKRLSGGNQQKVCIAGALTLEPDLLFVSEPTRGIDIGAKELVLALLRRLNAGRNVTVVVTSSELAELRSICDRIVVIYRGRVAGIVHWNASSAEIGLLMSGETKGEAA